ncbi:MAG TPA: molybdate ABC transporter permease subunit [Gemmataceae bacterium]|jgi:molybdate transport system permease protein|nr:molybdate ABC transporter permease subunit [Gemmataceae bacterium]
MDWTALSLTLWLATLNALILFALGAPLACWLARSRWSGKFLVEAVVALPLVMPPTVLGFYLLWSTGPHSPIGQTYAAVVGHALPFSFAGILVGTLICNVPFAVRPFAAAFAGIDQRLVEASWCLGVSRLETWRRIVLPLAWPGLLAGIVLTFAHTIGEFGVVLMIGGNIPGVTRTLSIAIFDDVQALDYAAAGRTSLGLVAFSFCTLCLVYFLQRRTALA